MRSTWRTQAVTIAPTGAEARSHAGCNFARKETHETSERLLLTRFFSSPRLSSRSRSDGHQGGLRGGESPVESE